MQRFLASASVLSLLALLAAPARAGVDVEINPAAKVKSSLSDAEVETYRFTTTAFRAKRVSSTMARRWFNVRTTLPRKSSGMRTSRRP